MTVFASSSLINEGKLPLNTHTHIFSSLSLSMREKQGSNELIINYIQNNIINFN
eukprot:m.395 g.395  ORF g.395 m.395 type:complete len:54 (-) comp241_c0_seq2:3-164(-)